jgi:DNA topoisomerase-3
VEKGEQVSVQEVIIKRKQTKPPKRYTEATLLSAMENAGKLVDDEELRERMKENGLGTPATRAAILERLLKVGYIERKGKTLYPTPKGMALLEIMPEKLKSPELTGEWEKKLYDIERGKLAPEKYMAEIKQYTKELVEIARESASIAVSTAAGKSIGRCPLCGAGVTRNRKGYGCSAWKDKGCRFFLGKIAGKKLSEKQVRDLLEKGQTKTIKGFTGKRGNKFDAALKIVEGKIEFLFPETHGKS